MIRLATPTLDASDSAALQRVLDSAWLSNGTEGPAFEEELAAYLGIAHAIVVSNGTTALTLALESLGIGPGDEVIVPAFTYLATLHAVRLVGAIPVIVDVERTSFNLDPARVAAAISPRTKALMPVDQFGLGADLEALRAVSHLPIVEDAACALGATRHGMPCGRGVALACYSFHPRKIITTGEGGLIVTDDAERAAWLRQRRNHGRDSHGRFCGVGGNYRLSELAAALGRSQLARLDAVLARRRELAEHYRQRLADHPVLSLQQAPRGFAHSYQTFALRLELEDAARQRDALIRRLREEGIECGIATNSATLEIPYAGTAGASPLAAPESHRLGLGGMALPLHPGLRAADVDQVCEALLPAIAVATAAK